MEPQLPFRCRCPLDAVRLVEADAVEPVPPTSRSPGSSASERRSMKT
jgi:hypothetical protein